MSHIKTPQEMLALAESTGLCGGTILFEDKSAEVEVLYISPTGARVAVVEPNQVDAITSTVHITLQIDRFTDLRGSVIWNRDSILGLQFDGAADMGLSADDDPNIGGPSSEVSEDERRRYPRKRVMLAACLEGADRTYDCSILDISLVGARLRIDDDFPTEELLQLVIDRFGLLPVEVMWQVAGHIGVQFLEPPETISTILKDFLTE